MIGARDKTAVPSEDGAQQKEATRADRGGHILYSGRRAGPLHGMRYAVTALAVMAAVGGASFVVRFAAANQPGVPRDATSRGIDRLPKIMLWAWERPEDLSFIDPNEIGVAFLAKTIYLHGGRVESRPRLQPLNLPEATALVAVVRIESGSEPVPLTTNSDQIRDIAGQIGMLAQLPRKISAIQIDFDARKSEREFYRALLHDLRSQIPAELPLSITALASWCVYDNWIGDLPVDEAVPMLFRMGVDDRQVRLHLETGGEFQPEISRGSLGISTDEPLSGLPAGKRLYVFSPKRWSEADVREIARRYGAL